MRGVTAWRREARLMEGGGLRAGDGRVRSRGVAAPPAAPRPAGGRRGGGGGVGSREAGGSEDAGRGGRYSGPAAAAAGEHRGPRPQGGAEGWRPVGDSSAQRLRQRAPATAAAAQLQCRAGPVGSPVSPWQPCP